MSKPFEVIQPAKITWRDGAPYAPQFDDIYFSGTHGLEESQYVFIDGNDLIPRYQALGEADTFVIGELGFGTGLNCLLAWQLFLEHAPFGAKLVIYSAEKHPLTHDDLVKSLNLWPMLMREAELLVDVYPVLTPGMHTLQFDEGRITLNLMLADALESFKSLLVCGKAGLEAELRSWQVDAWFLDGFSPVKNAVLWSSELFNILGILSGKGTTVATFSAAGHVRRELETAGFVMSKRQGFGQKRHCLQGEFRAEHERLMSVVAPQTPWAKALLVKPLQKQVIVVGAGLAGCFTAHALAARGLHVKLLDAAPTVAAGASGIAQAVLYPNLSGYSSPLVTWMLHAFLFATRTYAKWLKEDKICGELKGLLQFKFKRESLTDWLNAYPALGALVDAQRASILAGINIDTEALFVPDAGWIDSRALCAFLVNTPGIEWQPNITVHELVYEKGCWHVAGFDAPVVVLANGGGAASFSETKHLPLELFRGQMTKIKSNIASNQLKLPLCGSGHVLPSDKGSHWMGASYHTEALNVMIDEKDNQDNLAKLVAFPVQDIWSHEAIGGWAGIRAKTPDYLPLLGPVPDTLAFQSRFSGLSKDGGLFIGEPGTYYPGLYVCAGFGSRGLTSVPLAAEYLASVICHEPTLLAQSIVKSIAPARFLVKQIKQGVFK
ncbi:MAG: bifunctional tRNA (5-methylaminomethyl-2-thiouridine)(34)-methyltransferase MnmD/FAD-dependent 5-carboxymethylaminomethyl-2-thiouridine(34) oxidoreductase MnmC [Gammaproteobacteria bacterium]|nr:bifunctional tRNA (5-methylaminomethyl-2-thiouridine)(34)-methyltransferase MnmD/FAD-dependent 5-carboxymethylaminomethyl-2-thiouridine(34) oxidoreductase MnmC [Gammaproteobacteria bacterium]